MARALRHALLALSVAGGLLAVLGSPAVKAADLEIALGMPRVTFGRTGAELVRVMSVSAETPWVRAAVSSAYCEPQPSYGVGGFTIPGTCSTSRPVNGAATEGSQSSVLTLKMPQWHAQGPQIDVSLRAWRAAGLEQTVSGTDVEVELTQSFGAWQLSAGRSEPAAYDVVSRWRSTWAGIALRMSPSTRVRLLAETSHELASGARDERHTLVVAHALANGLRANLYVTRQLDDASRPWTLGAALAWSF